MEEQANKLYDGIDKNGLKYKLIKPVGKQVPRVNKKYGLLTALSPIEIISWEDYNLIPSKSWWVFLCDCGNTICHKLPSVSRGKIIDCGCVHEKEIDARYIGKTFNLLTVIERDTTYRQINNLKNPGPYYKCICKCGNYKTVRGAILSHGDVMSCGCLKKEQEKINLIPNTIIDLTGKKFGKLTVTNQYDTNRGTKKEAWWLCNCDCGKQKWIRQTSLTKEMTISCGCLKQSKGEYCIEQLLLENNIPYLFDKPYFSDLILQSNTYGRFDFIIFDNLNNPIRLIEYDGEQHYRAVDWFGGKERFKIQQINDETKNQYAHNHNLPLVRIPYTVTNITMETLFSDEYLV